MKRSLALCALAAVAICWGTIGTVRAEAAASHYDISIWNPITHAYPVTGTMDLTYHNDGTVFGYYHPAGLPSFIPITGGRTGSHVWLTIGRSGVWQLNGTIRDGKITGSAVNERPSEDRNIDKFGAPVALTGAAPIYSFVATPHTP
jgi:hypothetical protein